MNYLSSFSDHKQVFLFFRIFFKIHFSILFFLLVKNGTLHAEEDFLPSVKSITDIHCHIAGLGYGNSGCFISQKLQKSFKFYFFLRFFQVSAEELAQFGDSLVAEKISKNIEESVYIKNAVLLAMDGRVKKGELDRENSEFYVPNKFVLEQTRLHKNLLFGASINPYRFDAIERLHWAKKQGAVLLKWIPSIMEIDLSDPKLIPFYQALKAMQMPLLCHTGKEDAFLSSNESLNDPQKLILPLSLGVTVIASHIGTTGKTEGEDNFYRLIPLFRRYKNLYADISSLTLVNKIGWLSEALTIRYLKGRLIYGTDWPLLYFPMVSPWFHYKYLSIRQIRRVGAISNPWDRDFKLKEELGVTPEIFKLGGELLSLPQEEAV